MFKSNAIYLGSLKSYRNFCTLSNFNSLGWHFFSENIIASQTLKKSTINVSVSMYGVVHSWYIAKYYMLQFCKHRQCKGTHFTANNCTTLLRSFVKTNT